jgi:hypothetical protein
MINYNQFQSECGGTTSIVYDAKLPDDLVLIGNYPNPFNSYTTIQYQLSKNEFIDLSIYNSNGRLIEILERQEKDQGTYKIIWHTQKLSTGLYFVVLKTKSNRYCKKAVYVK